jgi:branched-chain amino acid transport system ATP-binding protein
MTVLEVSGLHVRYGAVQAVAGLDLRVESGVIVGLIGANGAGKTTALDALSGFVKSSGNISLGGLDITKLPPERRARAGLVRSWQTLELFDDLSVLENLQVAARSAAEARRLEADEEFRPIIADLHLADVLQRRPTELSQGQRKRLGVARALVAKPIILLADEPAAGLDTAESSELGEQLVRLKGQSLGILLVEHDMGLVLNICDYLYVLDHGMLIASGTPAEIRRDPQVIAAYLGQPAEPLETTP